jgi:TolB-like protein
MRSITLILVVMLVGCVSNQGSEQRSSSAANASLSEYHLHDYAGSIVMQLMTNAPTNLIRGRVIVGDFTASNSSGLPDTSESAQQLNEQMRHSMETLLTQTGFQVVTLDGNRTLQFDKHHRLSLGEIRNPPDSLNVDFILNGSFTVQQHAYLVNTKLVNISGQHIVAAATAEIPKNAFWGQGKVQARDGRLYRVELEGAR